ncbi:hypothetical protein [Paenibacillus sp. A14]|uniref:hypothetical protein n=1 Tax=Paenibacillus sp. A14 TaxID=3119820 RepID=UPI002FE327C0
MDDLLKAVHRFQLTSKLAIMRKVAGIPAIFFFFVGKYEQAVMDFHEQFQYTKE